MIVFSTSDLIGDSMDHDLPVNFGRFLCIDAQPRMVTFPVAGHILFFNAESYTKV